MLNNSDFPMDDEEDNLNAPALPEITNISELNIDEALVRHYQESVRLLSQNAPLNQKAQAMNTIIGILVQISRLQVDLYSAERFKQYEDALVETLKEFPEIKASFLEKYQLNAEKNTNNGI